MDYCINNVNAASNVQQTAEMGERKEYLKKVDLSDPVDEVSFSTKNTTEKKSGIGKKIGAGIASAFCPGFGQLVTGRGKSAAKHFFGFLGSGIACNVGLSLGIALAATTPVGAAVAGAIGIAGAVGTIGTYIHSIYDAAKNA